jgi:hypothetical protein
VKPSPSAGVFRLKARPEETDDSGSTKCDYRRILVARAQRRRPEGVRAREASALETIRLVLPNFQASVFAQFYFFRIVRFDVLLPVETTSTT